MSNIDIMHDMDPAARAVAEVRAREAGVSLGDWLSAAVYQQATSPLRAYSFCLNSFSWQDLKIHHSDIEPLIRASLPDHAQHTEVVVDRTVVVDNAQDKNSALLMLSVFTPRISHAAILLSAAFAEADVPFRRLPQRPSAPHTAPSRWYHSIVDTCLHRSREVRNAILHRWTPTGRAERLWGEAFLTLCDLTPAKHELWTLYHHDRGRASSELAKYLKLATRQFELSANLLTEVEAPPASDKQRFRELRSSLLKKAGGGVSLTEGAQLLGVTRQALHKRIKAGSALGMFDGDELVLPKFQFVKSGKKVKLLEGLSEVVGLFEHAGGWSALQFLVEKDPNIAAVPIDALTAGNEVTVVAAARAYLALDED
ncbi:helix-turn-helix domain-containing protein [Boseaceae bacterium BT-24-1]|nr:helix-turn-helix domain-containing protein [Boseaceae bacterium BT-24-1]